MLKCYKNSSSSHHIQYSVLEKKVMNLIIIIIIIILNDIIIMKTTMMMIIINGHLDLLYKVPLFFSCILYSGWLWKKKNEKITTVDKWWCWWRWSTTTATTSFRFNKFYIQQVSVCLFIWNIFIYKPLVVFFFWEQLKQKQTDEMMINLWRKKMLSNNDRWCLCVCDLGERNEKKKFQSKRKLELFKKFFQNFFVQ